MIDPVFYFVSIKTYKELGLLLVLVAVAILTYSSLVYFAEKDYSQESGLNCSNWQPDYSAGNYREYLQYTYSY